ncbi:LysR family transcriptional regulator [Yoonia sp. SS1-5]|uniref:LysR family transcriptional regulator n=1 Tax=Yoonia rhodophyticola TaxID=3137370 RepID=A0AAN0NI21_9RHOB
MNLTQLTVFREVMKTGSMSDAARNLGRTQPAISLALKSLEDSLGMVLFDRDTRNLKPVPEAYYLLSEADSVLVQLTQLKRTMERLRVGDEGELHLVAMPGVSTVLLPEFLSVLLSTRPDITLTLHTRSSTQLRELVSSQGVDLGFGDYEADHSRTLQTDVTKISANSFLALPSAHPLAQSKTVSIKALSGEVIGTMHPDHVFEQRRHAAFAREGATTTVKVRSQTVVPLLRFVASGQCCAVVDPLTVASAGLLGETAEQVVFRPLDQPIRYNYAILVPKMRPQSALAGLVATAWRDHVMETLHSLDAAPELTQE